jgi:hypothetical protein
MTTDNFCFYLQNRQIQTSQTGQWYSDTPPLVFPAPVFTTIISLGCKRLSPKNTLAYYGTVLIRAVKSFFEQSGE